MVAAVHLFTLSGFGVAGRSLLMAAPLLGLATLAGMYQMCATLAGPGHWLAARNMATGTSGGGWTDLTTLGDTADGGGEISAES